MLNPRLILNLKSNPQRSSIHDAVVPKTIRQFTGLRAKPQITFGRNNEINIIVNALVGGEDTSEFGKAQNNQQNLPPRICILGTSGIGKTTFSLDLFREFIVTFHSIFFGGFASFHC